MSPKFVNLKQGTSEWHEFRQNGIGSSDISVLLGNSPFKKTVNALRKEKVLEIPPGIENDAMKRGKDEEPKAFLFLLTNNPHLSQPCAIHAEFDYIRCSFDAICDKLIYEIKTPGAANLEKALNGDFPRYWIDQLQWQMLIADAEQGNLAIWDTEKAHIFPVVADMDWRERALEAAKEFWESVIACLNGFPLEEDYIELADYQKQARLEELRKVSAQIKDLEKRASELKLEVIDGMEANFILDGVKIFRTSNTTYDYKKMVVDFNITLDTYKKQSKPFWKIAL